jgi:chemotaxis protein MotB
MSRRTPNTDHLLDAEWLRFDTSSRSAGWIISYADMMTIILTFMILLLSISTIAQTKFDLLVTALTGEQVGNLQEVKKKVDEVIRTERLDGQVSTVIDEDGLQITFSNALLFASGEATLTERADAALGPIATHLVDDLEPAYGIIVEGYTDDVPIQNARFHSNWELSTSRAIDVMQRLSQAGIAAQRISVQGFADTRSATDVNLHDPTATTDLLPEELEEIRAKNRRVVIRVDRLDTDLLKKMSATLGIKEIAEGGMEIEP